MKTCMFIFSALLICTSCIGTPSGTSDLKGSQHLRESDSIVDRRLLSLFFDAQQENDKSADSAIMIIDSMISRYKDNQEKRMKYSIEKLQFLYVSNKTNSAIEFLRSDDDKKWTDIGGPYYKIILENRFLAKKELMQGDTLGYREYISQSLAIVERYISDNRDDYSLFLKNDLPNYRGKYLIPTLQLVYYSYLLGGREDAEKRIKLFEMNNQWDKSVTDMLLSVCEQDFMDFNPF